MPLYISKLAFVCPSCKKATRLGYLFNSEGKKDRFCKKCKNLVDGKKIVKKQAPKKIKTKK
jgi:large subunit ribosomal protein L24